MKCAYLLSLAFSVWFCFGVNVSQGHSELPRLHFFENKGQWPQDARYRADIVSGFVFLETKSLVFSFYDNQNPRFFHPYQPIPNQPQSSQNFDQVRCWAYRLSFLNSLEPTLVPSKSGAEHYRNYFWPQKTVSNVAGYDTVSYQKLYTGVDFRIFQSEYDLKYEFEVKAGHAPEQIVMQYSEVEQLFLKNGHLYIVHGSDTVIELAPESFQFRSGKKIEVKTEFKLHGRQVGFHFPEGYDKTLDLLIDPALIFSSFSGSVSDNWGNTAAYDSLGNLYGAGTVFGANFPFTVGSFDVSFNGEVDVVITKYRPNGSSKIYSSFFGGERADIPVSIICDKSQNLVILGLTASRSLPLLNNSFQKSHGGGVTVEPISGYILTGGSDLFLAKISENGKNLLASTYVGGNGSDGLSLHPSLNKNYGDAVRMEVILDSEDNPYIVYPSNSTNLNPTKIFGRLELGSVMVQKLNAELSRSLWLSSLGSSQRETGCTIRLLGQTLMVGGSTTGQDFPTTSRALQTSYSGGLSDGFLSLLNTTDGVLIASTYLGTAGYDKVFYADFDPLSGDIFCLGQTDGKPKTTAGLYSNPNSGQFLMRLKPDLSEILAATVLGSQDGNPDFVPTGFQVSRCKNINITGWAGQINQNRTELSEDDGYVGGSTRNLPTTKDAFIAAVSQDSSDFYFMVLSVEMDRLIYATFFGGSQGGGEHVDGGTSRFSETGTIYQAVCACRARDTRGTPPNIPTTDGSTLGSENCNNLVFKFDLGEPTARFVAGKNSGCAPLTTTFSSNSASGTRFIWEIEGVLRRVFNQNTALTHTFDKPGTYIIRYTVENPDYCVTVVQFVDTVKVFAPQYQITNDTLICLGESVTLRVVGEGSHQWLDPINVNSSSVKVTPSQTTTYRVKIVVAQDCEAEDEIKVEVVPKIIPKISVFGDGNCGEMPFLVARNQTEFADEFVWSINGEVVRSKEIEAMILPDTGCFVIRFFAQKGSCNTDSTFTFCVEKLTLPNVITPNGDGLNERFDINARYGPHKLVIVNRWGQIVYQSQNYKNDWSAADLEKGVYYYSLTPPSGRICKGWILVE
jgi:gliding motility-associated-like protein